jgi:cell division protein ZapA (FtsZ GTPase activity inhibitor)
MIAGAPLYVSTSHSDEELTHIAQLATDRVSALKEHIPDSHDCLLFALLSLSADLVEAQDRLKAIQTGTQASVSHLLEAIEGFERKLQR